MSHALALVAEDRHGEADEILARLIDETGTEPSTAQLLAMRAYVAERRGDAQQAVQYLLEAASQQPDWLALAAERVKALLAAQGRMTDELRLPLLPASAACTARLQQAFAALD